MSLRRKLTPGQILYVRRALRLRRRLSNKVLAKRFGVSDTTIYNCARER